MPRLPPDVLYRGLRVAGVVGVMGLAAVVARDRARLDASARARAPDPVARPSVLIDPAAAFRERCLPCHRLGGEGGTWGPDLDRVAPTLSESFVRDYVLSPILLDPGARMPPARGLSTAEAGSIAAYVVRSVRRPGKP